MNLVQLVGGQPLPNLLLILALKPAHVIQVLSSDTERFGKVAKALKHAVMVAGHKCTFSELKLSSSSPLPSEILTALDSLPPEQAPSIVNITGGNKLMALGAHLWTQKRGASAVYVDTEAQRFVCICGSLPDGIPTLPELVANLDLKTVLSAQGVKENNLKGTKPDARQRQFGRAAREAWIADRTGCADWMNRAKDMWCGGKGHVRKNLVSPLAVSNSAAPLLAAAVSAGWGHIDQTGRFTPDMPPQDRADMKRFELFVEKLLTNLQGGWFELFVADLMQDSPHFTEVEWSVEAIEKGLGETDIVALDQRALAPVFVSCKSSTSFDKKLEHVFALRERASTYGGTFAEAVLCVHREDDPDHRSQLEQFCRYARVKCCLGEEEIRKWIVSAKP